MVVRHLYVFGYQTPRQTEHSSPGASDDEESAAVFIDAPSRSDALAWGREVSDAFIRRLYNDEQISWKAFNYAHWIEDLPSSRFTAADLAGVLTVSVGTYPDWSSWP
jgi:hypothetical protein